MCHGGLGYQHQLADDTSEHSLWSFVDETVGAAQAIEFLRQKILFQLKHISNDILKLVNIVKTIQIVHWNPQEKVLGNSLLEIGTARLNLEIVGKLFKFLLREDVSIPCTNLKYSGESPTTRFHSYFHIL